MDAAVVIEMAQSERESPFVREMIAACNASVRGTCVVGESADSARALAVVTWMGDEHREVRIEVALRASHDWLTRSFELRASDPMIERWRSVGLVIATLVDEEERAAAASPPKPAPPPPPPPPPPKTTPRTLAWIDLTAWIDSSVMLGGTLRGAWYPARAPIFVGASIAYGTTPVDSSGVRVDSIAGAVGLGVSYDRARLVRLDALLAIRVERLGASVEGDAKDTALVSGLLSADFVWCPAAHFGVVVGGDAVVRSQQTIIQLRDVEVRRIPPFGAGAHLGVRVDF